MKNCRGAGYLIDTPNHGNCYFGLMHIARKGSGMEFFQFNATWIDLLISASLVLPYFIMAKILTLSGKPSWNEVCFIALACVFSGKFILLESVLDGTIFRFIWSVFPALSALLFYFRKLYQNTYALSATLAILSFGVTLLVEMLITGFQIYVLRLAVAPFCWSSFFVYAMLFFTATILVANQLKRATTVLATNLRLQKVAAVVSLLYSAFFLVLINVQYFYNGQELLFRSWTTLLMISYAVALFGAFLLYAKGLRARQDVREKELEYQLLLHYLQETEQQQSAMRKFKHDYQNMLISFEDFIDAGDMDGLRRYYSEKIKPTSEVITKSNFALEPLSRIKIRELKGLLTAKLSFAQNIGVSAMFEADSDIENIPTDTVALVRMLGIILDNAIEELDDLGRGALHVGCFATKSSFLFVVENTCRADIPNLRELGQSGFSTKGEGRGLGLSNLSEMAAACPNITLQTSVKDNVFLQKITIGRQ